MSSVPSEILEDVLRPLDRWTLDTVQFTSRRFLQVILVRMSDVCLREISKAYFGVPPEYANTIRSAYTVHVGGRRKRWSTHKDTIPLFSKFMRALKSSRVVRLTLTRLDFTPEFAALVLRTPIFADELVLVEGKCVEMAPAQFHEIVQHFAPTSLDISNCRLRTCQISDEFFRALIKNRVRRISLSHPPVDGDGFCVTDDAVIEFCAQHDVSIGQEGDEPEQPRRRDLELYHGRFTKDLFKRLIETSNGSTRPLRIVVFPVPVDDEDLRDFAQHRSYLCRGKEWQRTLYDFPGEPHGAVAAMRLQIVLRWDGWLEMIRARGPNAGFYRPNA